MEESPTKLFGHSLAIQGKPEQCVKLILGAAPNTVFDSHVSALKGSSVTIVTTL